MIPSRGADRGRPRKKHGHKFGCSAFLLQRASANSRAFSQLLELGKLNDLVSELTSAGEEEGARRRRRPPQLRKNETAESGEEEVTVFAAEAESAEKSETKKAVACDVEQKSVEGGFKRQNQVRA